jgi:lantibiotic modifying enzyme
MRGSGCWRQLLDGEAAERAWQSIFEVAAALQESSPAGSEGVSRTGGIHGPALFFTYLATARQNDQAADLAMAYLDEALETLASVPLGTSLYGGITGLGWTIQHLEGRLYEPDEEDDDSRQIDEVLLAMLRKKPWPGTYDLIHGPVGLGVYAVDGLPRSTARECLELVVERLAELAEDHAHGTTWFTPPQFLPPHQREASPNGYYNLGVAHGVPGVIGILAEACAAGVAEDRTRPLLERAVSWLLAHELPAGTGSCYTTTIAPDGEPRPPTRLAWCYGDAGVAAALLLAGRKVGHADWEREGLRIARETSRRLSLDDAGVVDAGLCHGAAGLGHIYNRFYQATGDETWAELARHWMLATLDLRRPGEGVAGYLSFEADSTGVAVWQGAPSFLTGASGIGLALLAAVSAVEPAWDRALLSSIPPRT